GDRVVDMIRQEDRTHGHISGGQSLGDSHEVRDDFVLAASEKRPGPAEPGNDLVSYEEDAVLLAPCAHRFHPAFGWNEHAARSLDRLGIERGDALRATDLLDFRIERG